MEEKNKKRDNRNCEEFYDDYYKRGSWGENGTTKEERGINCKNKDEK